MVSNPTSVTSAPTRTSASSARVAADTSAASAVASGKDPSAGGRDLPPPPEPTAAADLEETLRTLNELMSARQRNLSFHVDETSGRTVITVRDATTQQVVRQIPADEVLAVARALENAGALVDARA
jgi:flagellar protein FlaG